MKPNHPVPFRLLGPASVRALSIFALLCAASQAQAASSTWTSTSDTAFNTAGNWSLGLPGGTATNTDAANFTSTATGIQTSINLSSSDTVQTVSFASKNYTLTTTTGATLTIDLNNPGTNGGATNAIAIAGGTTETFNGSVVLANTGSTSAAAINFGSTSGTLTFGASSNLAINASGGLSFVSFNTSHAGTLNIQGTLTLAQAGTSNAIQVNVPATYSPIVLNYAPIS